MKKSYFNGNIISFFLLSLFSIGLTSLLSPVIVDWVIYIKYHIPKSEMSLCCTDAFKYVYDTLVIFCASMVFIFFILKGYRDFFQTKRNYGLKVGISIITTNLIYIFFIMMYNITYDSGGPFGMANIFGLGILGLSSLLGLIFSFVYSIKMRSLRIWFFLSILPIFMLLFDFTGINSLYDYFSISIFMGGMIGLYLAIFIFFMYIFKYFFNYIRHLSKNI